MLYECYVIFMFVKKHPELADDFIEYKKNLQYHMVRKEYKDNISNKETIEKIEDLKMILSEQKDDNFGNYDWTQKIIQNPKDRKLGYMASYLKLDEKLGALYKMSSTYIHSNPFSVFRQIDKKESKLFMLISIDILVNQITHFVEFICDNKTHYTIINLIINSLKNRWFEISDKFN
jgi:hypothetical protein